LGACPQAPGKLRETPIQSRAEAETVRGFLSTFQLALSYIKPKPHQELMANWGVYVGPKFPKALLIKPGHAHSQTLPTISWVKPLDPQVSP